MPLVKYQIRNEYGLADPELYRAADKDDPEALLEGVAMAGLVGVLRQLGDLAEFAAELFHDLHEEVLATAARGHGLMVRVQQLESEFPQIEKILLSQTNPLSSISSTGVNWHPNLHTKQNLISGGDLPRFVMDSYEECRGPPQLFLLDKFDVAGAGACLKRYTDPSIFKTEAPIDEVQREKRIRKLKRKGLNGRNGETPDITPASHAKLHQLFLVESIENRYNDPARLVKLKKRQLNESPFDSRNGRSYMENFVECFSPGSKTVHEVSVAPQPLPWIPDYTTNTGTDFMEVNASTPAKILSEQKFTSSSPARRELSPRPSVDELGGDSIHEIVEEHSEPAFREETDKSPLICEVGNVKSFEEVKTEGSVDGCHSDELTSEVENYMDALATIESETDTDNEYRAKADRGFVNVRKHGKGFDANDDQLELQAQFSDTQSLCCSVSDDGNSYFRKGSSNFSFSDNQSNSTENIPSDNDGIAKAIHSLETDLHESENGIHNRLEEEALGIERQEHVLPGYSGIKDDLATDIGVPSKLPPSVSESDLLATTGADELLFDDATFVPGAYRNDEARDDSRTTEHTFDSVPDEGVTQKTIDGLDDVQHSPDMVDLASEKENIKHTYNSVADEGVSQKAIDALDVVQHSSDIMELASERRDNEDHLEKVSDIIYTNNENSVGTNIDFPIPSIYSTEGQLNFSALPEQTEISDLTLSLENTPASLACDSKKAFATASGVDDDLTAEESNLESLRVGLDMKQNNFLEQQPSNMADGVPLDNVNLQDVIAQHEREVELEEPSEIVEPDDGRFIQNTVTVEGESLPLELQSHTQGQEEHVNEDVDDLAPTMVTVEPVRNILLPADTMCSSIRIEGFTSDKGSVPQKELAENGAASSECIDKIEMKEKADGSEVACVGLVDASIASEQPIEDIDTQNTYLVEQLQGISCKNDIIAAPADSGPDNDFEAKPSNETDYLTSSEDDKSTSRTYYAEPEGHLEKPNRLEAAESEMNILHKNEGSTPSLKASSQVPDDFLTEDEGAQPAERLSAGVHDVELLPTDEGSELLPLHSEPCSNGMDQQRHGDSSAFSYSHDQPSQSCSSKFLIQSVHSEGPDTDNIDQTMIPLSTNTQGTEFCHNADAVTPEDIPSLPPFSSFQWTAEELHHSPLSSQKNSSEHGQHALPSISSSDAYVNPPADSGVLDREVMQSDGAFSAVTDGEYKKFKYPSQSIRDDLSNECLPPSTAPDVDSAVLYNDSVMRGAKLSMESSAGPTTIMEQSEHTLDSGRQSIQFVSNAVSPVLADEEGNFIQDQVSPVPVSATVDSSASSAKVAIDQQCTSKNLEVNRESSVASGPSLVKQDEHLQQNLQHLHKEDSHSTAKEALLENDAGKTNGSLVDSESSVASGPSLVKQDEHLQQNLQHLHKEDSHSTTKEALLENDAGKTNGSLVDSESSVASGPSLVKQDEHLQQNLQHLHKEDSHSTTKEALLENDAGKTNGSLVDGESSVASGPSLVKQDEHPQQNLQHLHKEDSHSTAKETLLENDAGKTDGSLVDSESSVASGSSLLKKDEHLEQSLQHLHEEDSHSTAKEALRESDAGKLNGSLVDGENSVASGSSLVKQDQHLEQSLQHLHEEDSHSTAKEALPENDTGKTNGSLVHNIPRPPKPLIEAVAAHDRSKLRKVSERIQPPIGPKVEERDSLLEQIRTKSFNLRPALVTRPSMQGPRTNLKVAAILEKANAIRQAFADSDEDSDSWSDS